jgi:pyruvate ferredoxin oxidoreductase alpha subunit
MDSTAISGTKTKKGQVITDPRVMMNEAPRTPSFFTGSEVIKEAVKRANVDIMVAYPITPQSEAAALCGELFAEGYIGDYFRGESEFAVMSQCAGAAFGGARVFTTTAGPGTMRAMENFPMWAGARLPIQCIVTCRGINSPLSIQPDTIEIAYLMNTGMLVWHAETAQDFYDWILKGYLVSEEPDVHLPLALCCDGFFVTHTKDVVGLTPVEMCLPPYDPYRSPVPCMDMECPPVRMMRDPFVMKSNYISYATHASWQQEVWAAAERSRKTSMPTSSSSPPEPPSPRDGKPSACSPMKGFGSGWSRSRPCVHGPKKNFSRRLSMPRTSSCPSSMSSDGWPKKSKPRSPTASVSSPDRASAAA